MTNQVGVLIRLIRVGKLCQKLLVYLVWNIYAQRRQKLSCLTQKRLRDDCIGIFVFQLLDSDGKIIVLFKIFDYFCFVLPLYQQTHVVVGQIDFLQNVAHRTHVENFFL